jgi:hypothetical protein
MVLGVAVNLPPAYAQKVTDVVHQLDRVTRPARHPWVVTAAMVALYLVALAGSSGRVDGLIRLHERYDVTGTHIVDQACIAEDRTIGSRWRCGGALTWTSAAVPTSPAGPARAADGVDPTGGATSEEVEVVASMVTVRGRSELVVAGQATLTDRPYIGQEFNVFFDQSQPAVAYRQVDRLTETMRLLGSLVGRLLIMVGSGLWLLSRLFRRPPEPDPRDLLAVDASLRRDRRVRWAARGLRLLGAGVVVLAANAIVAGRLIGAPGII